jgi:hypothetical protein
MIRAVTTTPKPKAKKAKKTTPKATAATDESSGVLYVKGGGAVPSVIALCVAACALIVFTHLLISGKLTGANYASLLAVTAAVALVIPNLDRIKTMSFLKVATVTLQEMQQVRADVFAKAEEVRRLGEETAGVAVWNVARANRTAPSRQAHEQQMVEQRDKVAAMLVRLGSDQNRISEIVNPINDALLHDIKQDVFDGMQVPPSIMTSTEEELWGALEPFNRTKVMDIAHVRGLDNPNLSGRLDRVEIFMREKRLVPL